jgi:hypothetical protein
MFAGEFYANAFGEGGPSPFDAVIGFLLLGAMLVGMVRVLAAMWHRPALLPVLLGSAAFWVLAGRGKPGWSLVALSAGMLPPHRHAEHQRGQGRGRSGEGRGRSDRWHLARRRHGDRNHRRRVAPRQSLEAREGHTENPAANTTLNPRQTAASAVPNYPYENLLFAVWAKYHSGMFNYPGLRGAVFGGDITAPAFGGWF